MTLDDVMTTLASKGSASTKKIFLRHGAKEPFFGVKVADLKVLQKAIKGEQALALRLFATGNGDAQYLAGLVADGAKMTPAQLDRWARTASWCMISRFCVPWVASENPEGFALASKWTTSTEELVAVAGWSTLAALVTIRDDADLPVRAFKALLSRVPREISRAPDETRLSMNQFVIACGTYSPALGAQAVTAARSMGKVEADMGETSCEVPDAEGMILRQRKGASAAPRRKTVRC